ncbi:MAG: ABC transporter permease [Alphaproteobacteria bacterium]
MIRIVGSLLLRRLLVAVPMMLIVSLMVFIVLRLLPSDPIAMSLPPNATAADHAQLKAEFGLDLPIWRQYLIWLGHILNGNLGVSISAKVDVLGLVQRALPATIELVTCGFLIGIVAGVGGGLWMFQMRRNAKAEQAADLVSTTMLSIPEFLWAIGLILLFGVLLNWLPFIGRLDASLSVPTRTGFLLLDSMLTGRFSVFWNVALHMVLPSLALGLHFAPLVMRVMRSSLLDVANEDYIAAARQRGLSERRILMRYALRNAALPTVSLIGVQTAFLFGGTLLVEVIFGYPGLGNLVTEAVRYHDLPVIQAAALAYCLVVLIINAVVDVMYLFLNPRLRPA